MSNNKTVKWKRFSRASYAVFNSLHKQIAIGVLTAAMLQSAGIKKGFIIMIVNNQKISAPEDFEKIVDSILQGRAEDQGLFIKGFYPNGRTKYYAIDLSE